MTPGEAVTPEDRRAEAAIAAVSEWRGAAITYRDVTAPVMSPMHRNVDSLCFAVDVGDRPYFLKIALFELPRRIPLPIVFACAVRAAAGGAGPRPSHCLEAHDAIVFDRLGDEWRPARMDDLRRPPVMAAALAAKRMIHQGGLLGYVWSVFDAIRDLAGEGVGDPTFGPMLAAVNGIEAALAAAGTDIAASHADGIASNVMVDRNDRVRLVDFDMACDTDPLYEIGALLNEACTCDAEWAAFLEMYESGAHPSILARCRLYAIADDLYWALWSRAMAARSTRPAIEFLKYSQWRALRCRMALPLHDNLRRQL